MAKISSPTETEQCTESLIAVFQRYAGEDGNNFKLFKSEFPSFMNIELAAFTKNQKDPRVLDCMMNKLDLNSDGQLDFQEFLSIIAGLAVACHDSFMKTTLRPPGPGIPTHPFLPASQPSPLTAHTCPEPSTP
ncbi:protein S100-A11-like [Cynocephalus volans]|uniref:protein S100-A11-like n=1 Tax=Cynocephalus volans TaxID=110931 RepID=UPI002FC73607